MITWPTCEYCGEELELIRVHVFACENRSCPQWTMTPRAAEYCIGHPEIIPFMRNGMERLRRGTLCDGDGCITVLTPDSFHVHLPDNGKPMMLCMRCLHEYRIKNNLQFNN